MRGPIPVVLAAALAYPASASANAPMCDGVYTPAGVMVDAALSKYGTLYSGGNHWHRLDTVGATLDLYRLWQGLPDIALRDAQPPSRYDEGFQYDWNEASAEEIWERASGFMGGAGSEDGLDRIFAAWGADALTSAGPATDWWLRAGDFPDITPTQRWVAEQAPTALSLDWLQVLLAASNTPSAVYDHLGAVDDHAALAVLSDHAWGRYAQGSGQQWAVAAALAQPQRTDRVDAWLAELERDVLSCSASAADYAAWAVVTHGQDHLSPNVEDAASAQRLSHLPPEALFDLLDRRLMRLVAKGNLPQDWSWWRAFLPDAASSGASAQALRARLAYTQALSARTPAELPPPLYGPVVRLLNGLSSSDLSTYATAQDVEEWLVPVLFARAIAGGDWDAADDLLPRLAAQSEANAAAIDAAVSVRGDRAVKLSRVALALPSVQLHICGGATGADFNLQIYQYAQCRAWELPRDYAGGAAFDRDLEVFLRLPSRWDAFSGMRGIRIKRIERLKERRTHLAVGEDMMFPGVSSGPFPLSTWLDPSVTDAASGPAVFMPRIAETIIAWADSQSDTPRKRRSKRIEAVSETLGTLIRRCRRTPCGQVDGRPAQQVAFELLHNRMPDSPTTQQTPYWWASPER